MQSLYSFLIDFKNFPQVLPAEKISDFKLTEDGCSFNIQGIAALKVALEKKILNREVVYHITGPARSELRLQVLFSGDESLPGNSEVIMAAHLNPFLKAMAEKPLRTLANTIAEKLADLKTEEI